MSAPKWKRRYSFTALRVSYTAPECPLLVVEISTTVDDLAASAAPPPPAAPAPEAPEAVDVEGDVFPTNAFQRPNAATTAPAAAPPARSPREKSVPLMVVRWRR